MDEDQLGDLKQFIAATVSQATANMATKEDILKLDNKIDSLRSEMHDGFAGVGEAIEEINGRIDESKKKAEHRFIRLEQRTA